MLSFCQNTMTHIIDHIHEWRRCHSLCKINLNDKIFLEWFLKTLLPPVSKDVSFECPEIEEEAILKAQQFDLIYAQYGYLYNVILDAPHASTSYQDATGASHVADGIIGSISHQTQHHATPPMMPPHPSKNPSVSYPNQSPDYSRMISQFRATTSYTQPVPHQQAHAPFWPSQQYSG